MALGYTILHKSPTGACKMIVQDVVNSFIWRDHKDDDVAMVVIGFADIKDASLALAYYLTENYKGSLMNAECDPLFAPRERHRIITEVLRRHKITINGNEYIVKRASMSYLSEMVLRKDREAHCYVYNGHELYLFDYVVN